MSTSSTSRKASSESANEKNMTSFVMKEVGETGFAEKSRPECGPLDAVVKPTKGLVCTSDVHTLHGAIGERENLTLGHEVVGVVEEVGSEDRTR